MDVVKGIWNKNGKWKMKDRWRCKWWIDVVAKETEKWKDHGKINGCKVKELAKKKFLKNQNWEERNFWMVRIIILLLNFIF